MSRISLDRVLERANNLYEEAKGYVWDGYKAPEQRPQIHSDQVKAIAQALVEELNFVLEDLDFDIEALSAR